MTKKIYDILIVGGGHAGAEACYISSQFNLEICLVTSKESGIASAPCNPAVGGVGKGQVVREIDALGGLMGKLADLAGIQYRTLNESKGFAVQSTRVQIDKDKYSEFAEAELSTIKNLTIIRELVTSIKKSDDLFFIETISGVLIARKVIITTGTFLNGKLHTGEVQTIGGRVNCSPSKGLNEIVPFIKFKESRFKTGTPPRILRSSIDFSKLEEQESDSTARNFHYKNAENKRNLKQVSCFLTNTNAQTLSIIRANKERSPIFNGQIKGVGPRYCPSIEDKAFRYTEKDIHHVFIEPEGLELDTFYPNGISTSLPVDVQEKFLATIEGLEDAVIAVPGYAVEYDVVDTTDLNLQLESKSVPGIYFAGQVCGTSGYEEAAGQGIIAGINAAFSILGKSPLILDRKESYIGVMVEDLVTNFRDEPYRLFTARSENRLHIREDNTIERMYSYRKSMGLSLDIDYYQSKYLEELALLTELVNFTMYYKEKSKSYFLEMNYGSLETNISLAELLRRPDLNPIQVLEQELIGFGAYFSSEIIRNVAIATKYDGYITRSKIEIDRINRLHKKRINWSQLSDSNNISFECRLRIKKIQPETFGQLQNIEGIRPATLAYVAGSLV